MCEFSRFVEMQIYLPAFDSNNNRITKTNKAMRKNTAGKIGKRRKIKYVKRHLSAASGSSECACHMR